MRARVCVCVCNFSIQNDSVHETLLARRMASGILVLSEACQAGKHSGTVATIVALSVVSARVQMS